MKIALLAPLRYPIAEPYAGGLEAHTHALAIGLRELGHEVTLIARPGSDPSFATLPFEAPEDDALLGSARTYHRVMKWLRGQDFDVLQNNSIHWLPPVLAGRLPYPVVTTLHTPPYRTHRWSAGFTRADKHHYVSISHYVADLWQPRVGPSTVIHNGIALHQFPFAPAASPNKHAIWYGRMLPDKGPHHAIDAAREAGFSLTLAGPVDDQIYYDSLIKPHLGERIRHVGHVRQDKLATLIGQASVGLVTPVWDEPFGLVCAEMLACGTPVAAFAGGAVEEVLDATCSVVVPKGDSRAMARVLCEVASKPRAACRARAEAFSRSAMVRKYADLYGMRRG